MLCGSQGQAGDLNYCADETTVWIGEVDTGYDFDGTDLSVLFTDLATGTITRFDAVVAYSLVSIVLNGFAPAPGHKYSVTLTGLGSTGSLTQLQFLPFTYDSTTSDYATSTTAVDAMLVSFVKVHDQTGAVDGATEQWLSLR